MEFNPEFVARMIPKVEWAALLEAADTVRTLPNARARPECVWVRVGLPAGSGAWQGSACPQVI